MKKIILMLCFLLLQNLVFAQDKIITTSSNLKYKIVKPTNGAKPVVTDRVSVHLKIILSDGTVNYDTYKLDQPFEALPTQMIKGMTEGVLLMPLGSKFIFYVPSELAYGKAGIGTAIKPNENLVCEVELLKINGVGVPANSDEVIQDLTSQDENRPFMKLIDNTTEELETILGGEKQGVLEIFKRKGMFYQFLMKRSKELAAFNDPKWPIYKEAYRKLLVSYGYGEESLKDF